MRSVVLLLLSLCSCLSHGYRIQTIQQCGSHCNQGLHCKTKPDLSFPQCKKPPKGLQDNVSLNMSVSTVMKCEGRQQCSLFLQVRSTLLMNEHVKGVSICTVAAGVMERCRTHTFPKGAVKRLSTQQVEIQDNCFEVAVGQIVHVTLKTSPEFCHLSVSKMYNVPGCNHADLQKNVPECIGEITYQLDSEKKALSVSVSNMLESTDYNLRLCHKGYFCRGTGAYALLKKEEPVKNVTLQYARPLPCLCIEGWSSVFDAPRVQVCPFKNNMEELWSGVAFDSVEQMLSWEPACQTDVVVTLCQRSGEEICENLANASKSVSKTKVLFSTVDPHPQLCMKFTTKTATWIKCPFAGGGFTAWDIGVVMENGKTQLLVTSKSRPTLLISFCRRTGPSACEENKDVITFNVEKYQSVVPNLTFNMCGQNCCIQAKRADVKYAPTILHCDFKSSPTGEAPFPVPSSSHWEAVWIVAPAVGLLTALLVALFMLGIALIIAQCATSGYSRSKSFIADSVKSSSPQKALPRIYYNYPTHQDTANFENKNLLNWAKKDSTIV
ncbi:interleukin-17 receptor E isoform X2 [Sardina pilchardus]|uniref:interleukin-17 receptor E isoform X2 n=1 Tax=Sardina pilchardus TaxID=27697 RepID=UPI002E0D8638